MKILHLRRPGVRMLVLVSVLTFLASGLSAGASTFPVFDREYKLPGYDGAISGNTFLIGGRVLVRTPQAWVEQAFLEGGGLSDLDGATAVVPPYIYVRTGDYWARQQQSLSSWSKAVISGDIIAQSAPPQIYIWNRTATGWIRGATLTPANIVANDDFGYHFAIDGNTLVAGAPLGSRAESNAVPAAYVFVHEGNTWTQQAKLTAPSGLMGRSDYGPNFGTALDISGDTIVIGEPRDGTRGTNAGAVYVFVRNGTTWSLQQKITAPDAISNGWFGYSVAVHGNALLAGAPDQARPGSAWLFRREGTTWTSAQKFTPSDSAPGDQFGGAVRIAENAALISAMQSGGNIGSALYLYEPATTPEPLPAVHLVASPSYALENNGSAYPAIVTVTRMGLLRSPLTVRYDVSGTAEPDRDYEALSGVVTIPAGTNSAQIRVVARDDFQVEVAETVILTLRPDPAYTVASQSQAVVDIYSDDLPEVVTVAATDPAASETIAPATGVNRGAFTFARTDESPLPLTIAFTVVGSAVEGTDYQPLPRSITIPAGAYSAQLFVTPLDDAEIEGYETVTVTLVPGLEYQFYTNTTATLYIEDNTLWRNRDVGSSTPAGTGTRNASGVVSVSGGGADIADPADAFHFFYRPWRGDGTFIARITSLQQTDPWAKAGIMVRGSLDANSAYAFMLFRAGERTAFQWRNAAGQSSGFVDGSWLAAPIWLRVIRDGNSFTGYESVDGKRWVLIGATNNIAMPADVSVGFAVTSHRNGTAATATFDNLYLTTAAGLPLPPTDLTVRVSMNQIVLSWTDNSDDEIGFAVEKSNSGFTFGGYRRATTRSNVTTYVDGPFVPGYIHYYRVAALGPNGLSAYTAVVSATIPQLSFSKMARGTNGDAQLEFSSDFGSYNIEVSTNLVDWTVLTNIGSGYQTITDAGAASRPASFYRAKRWP